jgi:hypothetical protein
MIKLIANDGSLYLAPEKILLVRYPEGDCDSINWPFQSKKDVENLESALFDAREMGDVPSDTRAVTLPDGGFFCF